MDSGGGAEEGGGAEQSYIFPDISEKTAKTQLEHLINKSELGKKQKYINQYYINTNCVEQKTTKLLVSCEKKLCIETYTVKCKINKNMLKHILKDMLNFTEYKFEQDTPCPQCMQKLGIWTTGSYGKVNPCCNEVVVMSTPDKMCLSPELVAAAAGLPESAAPAAGVPPPPPLPPPGTPPPPPRPAPPRTPPRPAAAAALTGGLQIFHKKRKSRHTKKSRRFSKTNRMYKKKKRRTKKEVYKI
jgi:hypothetical protein